MSFFTRSVAWLGLLSLLAAAPTSALAQPGRPAPSSLWHDAPAARQALSASTWAGRMTAYRAVAPDAAALAATLAAAPLEGTGRAGVLLELPLPDGGTARFRVVEAPVMEAPLAAQYPQIKTYAGIGLDDPTASLRCDLTPRGFHAQVLSRQPGGTFYIDPVDAAAPAGGLVSYWRHDLRARAGGRPPCLVQSPTAAAPAVQSAAQARAAAPNYRVQTALGTTLRTYRLALAATGEYTAFAGGTTASALAAMTTSINRVTGVYEKELGVRLVLVANTNLLIFTNAATDPYTNTDGDAMLTQNQTRVDAVIGNANYDIGHVFSTGGGGVAVAGVCVAGDKALGVTGSDSPTADPFDIDYVCHEMGHQFGGNHPFNGTVGSCSGGNREATMAYEPGSGSTIMAYAGICDGSGPGGTGTSQDLQANSDAYFHGASISEISSFITSTATCVTAVSSGNTPPTVATPVNKTIPANTPFRLTASATDADGDALTYNWEEMDLGTAGAPVKATTTQTTGSTVPLFRSWLSSSSPTRYFPRLNELRSGTVAYGEAIPTVARTLKFRCTVRDEHFSPALGRIVGGVNQSNTVTLTTVASTGFAVTAPNTAVSLTGGASTTVTWSVAGTSVAPVSCATVDILLSTDGGLTFPTTLLAGTANDGTQAVTLPNSATTQARIMVQAADNYFFDISNANFTITASSLPAITSFTPSSGCAGVSVVITGTNFTGATAVTFNNVAAASFTVNSATSITAITPAGVTAGTVKVTTASGTATSAGSFTPTAAPTVSSFTPTSGVVGTNVTITGTNFTGATAVTFGGTAATSFTVNSATSITATVPAGATTGNVGVTGVCGVAVSSAGTFTVTVPAGPTITSFTPTSGCAGATVAITGTGFTGATAVTFNNVAALSFTVNSATSITAITPAGVTAGNVRVTTASGTGTSAGSFSPTAAPTITSFTPATGVAGTSVTITGTNFTGATAVRFNGTAASFTVASATSITATAPAGATTGTISVTGACGAAATSAGTFTVTTSAGPPTIASFTPTSGAPGSVVTITGTNFGGASIVKFNTKTAAFTVVSSTTITATVPATATTGKISVTTPLGTASSLSSFSVAPSISAFTPGAGSVGSVVIVTGLNFVSGTTVRFNGVSATTTYNSATQLTAVVPGGATSGPLSVTNTFGTGTSAGTFTVTTSAAPTITSFTPTSGVQGTTVTITGTNFTGATAVRFNATTTTAVTVLSATQVSASVPLGATTGFLYVVTPNGMAKSVASFTITPPPTLTLFAPTSGSPGSVVTLTGTNFTAAATVAFNGVPSTSTYNSATSLTATVPAGATTGRLTVTTVAGTALSSTDFTVTTDPAPTISSISPTSGPVGTVVTITGTNLVGVSSVKVNATAAPVFTVSSPTSMTVTVPTGATTGRLFVTAEGGMAQSPIFTVILAPTISSFTPTSGPAGTLVTINGTNFTGISGVAFGGVAATSYTVVSTVKITATVPSGAVTGAVTVTNPAGTATKSTFTYTGLRPTTLAAAAAATAAPVDVYPNPAHELVRISGPTNAGVTLRDALGRKVRTAILAEGATTLDVRGLPPGIYLITIATTTHRLVVE